jgi:beta-lactam-binding protein with PASTA domain
MRYALTLVPVLILVGCGGGGEQQRVVPDVRGQRLDRAEHVLAEQKLDWREEGASGVETLVRSNWKVCSQAPAPGKLARRVILRVARSCANKPAPTVSAAPRLPWLDGSNLHEAKEELDTMGIGYSVQTDDDFVFVDRLWTVCSQYPDGGTRARFVELRVAHDCWEH